MLEIQLHFISAIFILLAAVVPIYLTLRLSGRLRKLVLILTIFILVHSLYHIAGFFGLTMLAEAVFEPLSVAVLIFFGIIYYETAKPKLGKNLGAKSMMSIISSPGILFFIMDNITTMLLFVALGLFGWLAIKSRNIRNFQFQISIFIIIWTLGEIASVLRDSKIIVPSPIQSDVGLEIHVISMFFFSMMLWLRFYYSQRNGKKMIEDVDTATG
jgi:hypothetical protein